jgi:predicted outer membrane repeat protein
MVLKMKGLILFALLLMVPYANAQTAVGGRLITVNDVGDSNDVNAADGICLDLNGKCTLRAAIQESNVSGSNVINFALPSGSIINLTLGELLITKPVHVIGPGARRLTVQRSSSPGTASFRIFHFAPNAGFGLIIRGLKIKNGYVEGDGGGFYIEKGNIVYLNDLTISNNSAKRGGGIANAGIINAKRLLINSNTALILNGAGGAINIDGESDASISNSTITENSASNGGAIYNQGNLTLVNNTITGNTATSFGSSLVSTPGATVNVLNTIIGMDVASGISSLWGEFNSLGNNLITDARNSTGFTNGVNNDQVSNNNTINPMLGNLSENGGQTDTRALLPGSPAIDRGNNCVTTANCAAPQLQGFLLSTDQRINYTRRADKQWMSAL